MGLQGTHGRDKHHGIRLEARAAALDVPELLIPHIGGETALRHDIVAERTGKTVRDDGVLAYRDVRERSGVHKHRLPLQRLHERGLQGLDKQCAHGAVNLKVGGGHRLSAP